MLYFDTSHDRSGGLSVHHAGSARETGSGAPRVNVLGVGVDPLDLGRAIAIIEGWIDRGERHYTCVTGVHGVMESQRDEALRRIHNAAGLVTPDGMPLVWLCRLQGARRVDRVYGPDLLLAYCAQGSITGRRHFFYGGCPESPRRSPRGCRNGFPS